DEGVELPESVHRLAHGPLVVLHLRHVAEDPERSIPVLPDDVVEPLLNHVDDCDARAFLDVAVDDSAPDAGAASRDDCDLSVQLSHHHSSCRRFVTFTCGCRSLPAPRRCGGAASWSTAAA